MKKIVWVSILSVLFLVSCTGKFDTKVEVSQIMETIKREVDLQNGVEEDIKSMDNAERYGLTLDDIEEGRIYYTKDAENPDKIMVIKAKNEDSMENIEKAMNAETIGLMDAWKNTEQTKKVENHILKTRGRYVLLMIGDDAKRVESIFDRMINMT